MLCVLGLLRYLDSTLHTAHYMQHITYSTLNTTHYTAYNTLHTAHYTLHSAYNTLHTAHCTLHIARYTPHITICILHIILYKLHTEHYTLHYALQCQADSFKGDHHSISLNGQCLFMSTCCVLEQDMSSLVITSVD